MAKFGDFGFDERIMEAIAKQGWGAPTTIQEKMFQYRQFGNERRASKRVKI